MLNNYKTNLKNWVNFACATDQVSWNRDNLSKDELAELLAILAGYFGATTKGKEMLKGLL
jgi:pyridoxal/pyridoxine/pyridoxamine kinase